MLAGEVLAHRWQEEEFLCLDGANGRGGEKTGSLSNTLAT